MSVWTTKSLNKECNYIVLKHTLRGVNYVVGGVKFRDGYAVVEKGSKTYNMLKRVNILRNAQEFPLLHLRKLKFITRNLDVKIVYGQDVYRQYLKVLVKEEQKEANQAKEQAEELHAQEGNCTYILGQSKQPCLHKALEISPSQYCYRHILEDPRLRDYDIKVPKFITKDEKEPLREKVIKQLEKVKSKVNYGKDVRSEQEAE